MNKPAVHNKILLVQLFSNGDCLYATTIARQIKQDYPGCHLTWAVAGFCRSILEGNPYIDAILEINDVPKNDVTAFRRLKKRLHTEKRNGLWKELFITHIMDNNQAYYDGCIRTTIFHAYPHPVTISNTPVLSISEIEKNKVREFVRLHSINKYDHVILFEFAPQSGQLPITKEIALKIAENLSSNENVAVILSSAHKVMHPNKNIIDGSALTLRETAALTLYCTLLIGCSSGITWIATSDAAKLLPMIQLVNPYTDWVNPVSRDFKRFGKSTDLIIDIIDLNEQIIVDCVQEALTNFSNAKRIYNQVIPLHFKTTRKIVYNLLCYLQFKAIRTHIRINRTVYGDNIAFYKAILFALIIFPFKLTRNLITKKLLSKQK